MWIYCFQMEDKKMHSYAVIPPLLLPPDERARKFENNNGLILDPLRYINLHTRHLTNYHSIVQLLDRVYAFLQGIQGEKVRQHLDRL